MKRFILNPHLMMIGFITLIVVSSDSSVKAQDEKRISRSIIIKNGDTVVNGKKLSEVSQEERIRLKREFKEMENRIKGRGGKDNEIIISSKPDAPHVLQWNDRDLSELEFDLKNDIPGEMPLFKFNGDSMSFNFNADTILQELRFQMNGLDSNLRKRIITMHRNMMPRGPRIPGTPMRTNPPMAFDFERRGFPDWRNINNSSSYNYNSTDKNGISNRMSIRISDAEEAKLKTITSLEKVENLLEVKDMMLFPNFSNGKLGISFNLETKGPIKLCILNSDLKQLFTDEITNFNGSYMKQVSVLENGVYYISINQNKAWYVKRFVKE